MSRAYMEKIVCLTPPLKWAGGKRWLVPHLKPIWQKHSHRRLIEPFCGGLAVTLGLAPERALLNDINAHLINFYRWVKHGLGIKMEMKNDAQTFYECRSRFNSLIKKGEADSQQAAELFYYLNRTCFNGLCRFNNKDEFNVPFGKYKTINYAKHFYQYQSFFAEWEFTRGSFEEIEIEAEDFIYADPPYDVEFTKYSKENFGWDEQVRLAEWLSNHKGAVVLSNQATDRIMTLYRDLGFHLQTYPAPRMISCTGDRTPALEVLAYKNL